MGDPAIRRASSAVVSVSMVTCKFVSELDPAGLRSIDGIVLLPHEFCPFVHEQASFHSIIVREPS